MPTKAHFKLLFLVFMLFSLACSTLLTLLRESWAQIPACEQVPNILIFNLREVDPATGLGSEDVMCMAANLGRPNLWTPGALVLVELANLQDPRREDPAFWSDVLLFTNDGLNRSFVRLLSDGAPDFPTMRSDIHFPVLFFGLESGSQESTQYVAETGGFPGGLTPPPGELQQRVTFFIFSDPVEQVPEPGTWLLVPTAAGLAWLRRKKWLTRKKRRATYEPKES